MNFKYSCFCVIAFLNFSGQNAISQLSSLSGKLHANCERSQPQKYFGTSTFTAFTAPADANSKCLKSVYLAYNWKFKTVNKK